ncbi:MAG: hypothetical protein AAFR68_04135 [Pseudomonadota bacterium]
MRLPCIDVLASISRTFALASSVIEQLTMTGLTDGAARPGDDGSISLGFPDGVTSWTSQSWGVSYGDSTYGTGANPTDYTAGDGAGLFWEGVGDDAETYRAFAPIQYAEPTVNQAASITGDATQGVQLTGTDATFNGTAVQTSREWEQSDDGSTDWTGTGTASLISPAQEAGKYLRLRSEGSNSGGTAISYSNVIGPAVAVAGPEATGSIADQIFAHTGSVQTIVADVSTLFTGADLEYAVSGYAGAFVATSGGALTINPQTLTASSTITLTATNGQGSAQITFDLEVATLAFDGTPTLTGSGIIGEVVTAAAVSTLAGAVVEAQFLYDGVEQQARSTTLTHTVVEDVDITSDALTVTLYLTRDGVEVSQTVGSLNTAYNAPVLGAAPAAQVLDIGSAITATDIASSISVVGDADLSGVTYALAPSSDPLPAGLSLSGSTISGTPTTQDTGNTIVVRASNSGGSVDVSFAMDVFHPVPVAAGTLDDQSFVDGSGNQTFDVSGDFTFGGTLNYAIQTGPAGVTISSAGVITFNDSQLAVQSGTSIVVRASDAANSSRFADSGFSLSVTAGGATPITNVSAVYADGGEGISDTLTVNFEHDDSETLTLYGVTSESATAPSEADIIAGTGTGSVEEFTLVATPGATVPITGLSSASDSNITHIHLFIQGDTSGERSAVVTATVSGMDNTLPTLVSAVTDTDGDAVTLTFSEGLPNVSIPLTDFSIGGVVGAPVNPTSITGAGTQRVLNFPASAIANGETVTVSYTGTALVDGDGSALAAITNALVTNNVTGGGGGSALYDEDFATNDGGWTAAADNDPATTTIVHNAVDGTIDVAQADGAGINSPSFTAAVTGVHDVTFVWTEYGEPRQGDARIRQSSDGTAVGTVPSGDRIGSGTSLPYSMTFTANLVAGVDYYATCRVRNAVAGDNFSITQVIVEAQ